jgi:superfamily II DNA/RNA helicase
MSYSSKPRFNNRGANRSRGNFKNNHRRKNSKYINPERFVATAQTQQAQQSYTPQHAFSDFAVANLLHQNLQRKGYHTPSPIQDQTIPAGLAGRDVIGMAGTGTGKTAAFALPVLHKLITDKQSMALIIAPTRELAQQIEEECEALAIGSNLRGALLIGGSSMGAQLRDLRRNPTIIIGTPGRIKDHLQRGSLQLHKCNLLVLDEVDRMLDMGFVVDVREILNHVNEKRQSFFFSATMDARVRNLIDSFTHNPISVEITSNKASESVHQDIVRYNDNNHRLDQLHDLLLQEEVSKAIVFDETQRSVERLSKTLYERGFSTEAIHGGKSQSQRQRALRKFKNNEVTILVATDVAARGIDVADITHVINYSTPSEYEDYIHRIGRAGRAGQTGYAYTFVAT